MRAARKHRKVDLIGGPGLQMTWLVEAMSNQLIRVKVNSSVVVVHATKYEVRSMYSQVLCSIHPCQCQSMEHAYRTLPEWSLGISWGTMGNAALWLSTGVLDIPLLRVGWGPAPRDHPLSSRAE